VCSVPSGPVTSTVAPPTFVSPLPTPNSQCSSRVPTEKQKLDRAFLKLFMNPDGAANPQKSTK
jgi:hypothetical protein